MIKNERKSLAGTISFVSGDNLGSQLIGGFKEGSGAHKKCRHCMGTTDAIKSMVSLWSIINWIYRKMCKSLTHVNLQLTFSMETYNQSKAAESFQLLWLAKEYEL